MWKNIVETDRLQVTVGIIQGMCFERWIPKATNTLSECVILTGFPLQLFLFQYASVLHDTCIACRVLDPTANSKSVFNLLAPELLFSFLILAQPLYKM